jgi:hypothetical protein
MNMRSLSQAYNTRVIPVGYLAKRVRKPAGFNMNTVTDVYSVGGCVNDDFADYINFWRHNGFWLFDSPQLIKSVAKDNSIDLTGTLLFYYEVYEREFDGKTWLNFQAEPSFPTSVAEPEVKQLEGFDVVTFYCRTAPEHSPLSCNGLGRKIPINAHCLLTSFDGAFNALESGAFTHSEQGPYRIFAVYSVDWPEERA